MDRKGASVSPCKIPATIEIGDVSPSDVSTVEDVSVYKTLMASIITSAMP